MPSPILKQKERVQGIVHIQCVSLFRNFQRPVRLQNMNVHCKNVINVFTWLYKDNQLVSL